jgi:hypothetical protein
VSARGRAAGVGRQKGTPNKATAEIREAARVYTHEALEVLAHVMRHGTTETARVAAADKLLDRAYGRPAQALRHAGPDDGPIEVAKPIEQVLDFSVLDREAKLALRMALKAATEKHGSA